MKRKILSVLVIITAIVVLLSGCGEEKSFTVSFDSKGGSKVESITLKDGETLNMPAVPVKEGFNFICWEDKNGTPIYDGALLSCEDITLYAKWEEIKPTKFTVTFDSKGGSDVAPITLNAGDALTMPAAPVKEGFEFICWEDKNSTPIYDGALLSCDDITLYAKWNELPKTYTITFNSNGGSKVDPIVMTDGVALKDLPKPTLKGYTFICWKDKNQVPISEGAVLACEDITLYAWWHKTSFTVTFDSKGGSAVAPITLNDGETLSMPPAPVKEGYDFITWEDKNCTPIYDGALLSCDDITLYAVWGEKE